MLGHEMRSHREAPTPNRPVVLDRGVPDVVGHLRLEGIPVPARVAQVAEVFRCRRQVVLAPHWPATDAERRQSPDIAEATCRAMVGVHAGLGHEIAELPRAAVPERVRFVPSLIG